MTIETTYKQISYDEWEEKYVPITNFVNSNASFEGRMFETYGEELEAVAAHAEKTNGLGVWTLMDSDEDDEMVICNGFCYVNRIGYFITENPYGETENIDVVLD